MKIGIDISVLQTGHRMRGIGYTLINFINYLPVSAKKEHEFVFFAYPEDQESTLELLNLEGFNYELRTIHPSTKASYNLPGKLRLINKLINFWRARKELRLGDPRISDLTGLDWFMQFDQNQALPSKNKVKSILVLYDIIPYIMEADYLWSYKTARLNGCTRKSALRHHLKRQSYVSKTKQNASSAAKLLAISEHTKHDFVKHIGINPEKITVCLLGVEGVKNIDTAGNLQFEQYLKTSWGYFPKKVSLKDKKFLLFVGGVDPRRHLVDLVAAFNNLKAQGEDIKLVLTGDTMKGAFNVPNMDLQKYLHNTSYLDDIYFMGFVSDQQISWLYKNAVAFVYPSVYEGFGLPILQAMQFGTPVITYKNSSIPEVAGNAALYAADFQSIANLSKELTKSSEMRKKYAKLGQNQAAKFSWQTTAKDMLKALN